MFTRDSAILNDENIEVIQFRRRNSLIIEEEQRLEPIQEKDYNRFEEVRLSDTLSRNGVDTEKNEKEHENGSYGVAPDGGYGWIIVLCSFFLNFIVDGITLTEGQLHGPILKAVNGTESHFEEDQISWVNGCLTGVTLLVGPLASVVVNRFGFRFTVIIGALIASAGILLSWAASPHVPNIYCLIIFYGILGGIGFGLIFAPSVVIVTHYFEKKRALATGIAICGTGMGTLGMAPLGTYLIQNFGWTGTIPTQAAIVLLCIVFGLFLVQPPTVRPLKKLFSRKNDSTVAAPTKRRPSIVLSMSGRIIENMKTFIPFLKSPTYMILALSGGITMLGFFSPFAYTPARSEKEYVTGDEGRLCLMVMGWCNVIARIVFGFLSDRPWTNNLLMSNTALTICGLATSFSYLIQNYAIFVVYCGVFGFCIGCFATLRSILILEFIGLEKMNDGFGLSLMFMGIASLFSSPIAGYLITLRKGMVGYEKYDLAFQVAGFFVTFSAVLCYPLRYVSAWENSRKAVK